MQLRISLDAELFAPDPSPAVALIEAADARSDLSTHHSEVAFDPDVASERFRDLYGNMGRRLRMPAGATSVRYQADVEVRMPEVSSTAFDDPDLMRVPGDVMLYTLPSRYCPSDQFAQFAVDHFGRSRPGVERVNDVCRWICESVRYRYGVSNTSTTAVDTMIQRVGVCRDFAHLGIAVCRGLNIPARYVSGYCLDLKPQDLHAYFQAYLGGEWVDFDPTAWEPRTALVPIAHGRDAADCAWWTIFGSGSTNSMSVSVTEATEEVDDDAGGLPQAA